MSEYTYPEFVMFTRIDRIRDPYVTGPCPNKQSLCERIARERNGDAVSDCVLCNANHYMTDANQRHYPVPAISRVEINERGTYLYCVDAEYTAWFGPLYAWRITRVNKT